MQYASVLGLKTVGIGKFPGVIRKCFYSVMMV